MEPLQAAGLELQVKINKPFQVFHPIGRRCTTKAAPVFHECKALKQGPANMNSRQLPADFV